VKNVLVIGDVILDEYTHGHQLGVSAETPTVVAELEKVESFVGGAGLVVRHLLRLGCHVRLMTVTGADESVEQNIHLSTDKPSLEEMNRFYYSPFVISGWCLSRKKRYFVGDYKMVQYDVLNRGIWDDDNLKLFCQWFDYYMKGGIDCIVICDNRHGVMTKDIAQYVIRNSRGAAVFVDSQVSQKSSNHLWYDGCTMMFLNERELDSLCPGHEDLHTKMGIAVDVIRSSGLILKMGQHGSMCYTNGQCSQEVPAPSVKAIDTCGAGDAYLAAYVAYDGDMEHASKWASLTTTIKGTIVPKVEDETALFG
jgi:bifunctional ADP-heptose synthase (sugar kinase/adenylyltransferase)